MINKPNQKYLLPIFIIILIVGWFYWFQWRPSMASKECIDGIKFEGSPSVEKIKIVLDICMMEKGIVR